jgi:alpha-galactosidase
MKIVIIGAGSIAFTPAILSGFSVDPRYHGATIGLVDINPEALDLVQRFAERVSQELELDWHIQAATDRRQVLSGADVVTAAVGVGGLKAWEMDVDIPYRYGILQPVGDTSGPGGLARALRHVPVLVEIAQDMEALCPNATLYNFTNPLTVLTQAVNQRTKIRCIGLCIGVNLTWDHLCRLVGVERQETSITAGGINHCHWVTGFRIHGEDAFPVLQAALDELSGSPQAMSRFRARYGDLIKRPQEPQAGEPLCETLFRQFGAYPGPGDGHVGEFFPQLMRPLVKDPESFQGHAIKYVKKSYPLLTEKMRQIALEGAPVDAEDFARELSWEHTQFLDIMASQQDNRSELFFVNLPNRGYIHNLPEGAVVETPALVDAAGLHPFALGDLPPAVVPTLLHKLSSLDLIIEAALEGSRRKAVQAFLNDPHCTDMAAGEQLVHALIDAELAYLPRFKA